MSEPVDEQGQPARTVGADQTATDVQRRPRAPGLQHWRFYLFAFITIASFLLGFLFKASVKPSVENQPFFTPQTIEVFTTDPQAQVKLAVEVFSSISIGRQGGQSAVYLSIIPSHPASNVSWIIVFFSHSSSPSRTIPVSIGSPDGKKFSDVIAYGDLKTLADKPVLDEPLTLFPGMTLATSADTTVPVATEARGNLYAHLPHIGSLGSGALSVSVPLIVETSLSTGQPISAIFDPRKKNQQAGLGPAPTDPAQYVTSVPGALPVLFYEPQSITTTELLLGGGRYLRDSQSTSMVPPDGQVRGEDLLWISNGPLEPTVTTTSIGDTEARSSFDFYSGIALATGAAALIAAVQELPSKLAPAWVWRRTLNGISNAREADGAEVDQSPQPPCE